jgi:predicted PurR-regulated permease PerM
MAFSFTSEQKQSLFWVSVWIGILFLLYCIASILTPFVAAAILAYALNPAVDVLTRLRLPRSLAVVLVILIFLSAILALIFIVVPVLQKEAPQLRDQIPIMLDRLNDSLGPKLRDLGMKVRLDSIGLKKLLSQQFSSGSSSDAIWDTVLSSAKTGGTTLLSWLATAFLVPVALFYLLLDWHNIVQRVQDAIPRRWVGKVIAMTTEVDQLLAQYLRGQLLVMLILAAYYSTALMMAGFEVALPVGIITGLLVFIPYLGFGLGLVLALIAAMLQFQGWHGLIAVAVVYGSGQILEGFFLTPRLVGERIGLNPLAVIFALMAFGQLFGFTGVLLALPTSAILMVGFKHLRMQYLESSFYRT